ncbi:MAG: ABC transporter permease [Gemmatimonadetes bacterium]|nr:ABC transporter permease [Gemmatimonadota bacterium]
MTRRRLARVSLLDPARITEGVGIALESIRVSKARAALTILGVAIGVMVVIAMASMITGINKAVTGMLEQAGPKTFMVMRHFHGGVNIDDGSEQPWDRNPWVSVDEGRLLRRVPGIAEVAWREETNGPASAGLNSVSSIAIVGATPNLIKSAGGQIISGRAFTEIEDAASSYVAIINDKLAEQLFPGTDPLGRLVKLFGIPYTVVGVYAEAASLFSGSDTAPIAVMPHSTFSKAADYWRGGLFLIVKPDDSTTVVDAQDRVITALRVKRGLKPSQENNFSVVTQDKMMEVYNKVTGGFFLVMLALSSVGLLVGGVGVVAIMMISVTERTREIGVRKALGATRREIMFQFLIEAATLTLLGGTIGMAFGGSIAWAVNRFSPIPAAVPLWSVVAAVAASAVTGIFFGLYPARKAARLDPVDALRYE